MRHDGTVRRWVSHCRNTHTELIPADSAFDLLRNPHINTGILVKAVPELTVFEPQLLARIDIDGADLPSMEFGWLLTQALDFRDVQCSSSQTGGGFT